jgi:MscS family membrane protein
MVSITYDTPPDKIDAFCQGIRDIVGKRPNMRQDYFHVYLNQFAPSSLDILVYVFFKVPDWAAELKERQEFMLDVIRLAEEMKVELAFPTQTIHIAKDDSE